MIERRTWEEFRNAGFLWFVNTLLQPFGWSLVIELNNDGSFKECYPARSHYRGFTEDVITKDSKKLTQYMIDNAQELIKDYE